MINLIPKSISIELLRHTYRRAYSTFKQKPGTSYALPLHFAQGMDGARYQVNFDPSIATLPMSFAFQKLTEGTSYRDTSIDALWEGVKQLQVRGGYHYQRSGMSWTAQANNYLGAVALHDYNIHAIDLEGYGNTYSDTMFADTMRIMDTVERETKQRTVLYTNISTYTLFAAAIKRQFPTDYQDRLNNLLLWIAYPSTTLSAPPLPTGRSTALYPWSFWQDNWNCTGCGCQVASDHNFFNGSIDELYKFVGASTTPPPTGDPMLFEATLKDGQALNVRNGVGQTGTQVIYTLNGGDKVIGARVTEHTWFVIDHLIIDGNKVVPEMQTYCSSYSEYYSEIKQYIPPAPAHTVTLDNMSFTIDDEIYEIKNVTATKRTQ